MLSLEATITQNLYSFPKITYSTVPTVSFHLERKKMITPQLKLKPWKPPISLPFLEHIFSFSSPTHNYEWE